MNSDICLMFLKEFFTSKLLLCQDLNSLYVKL